MAALRNELYGIRPNAYANDPEWDDVIPIPQEEPDGALAAIAYAEDYAEGMQHPVPRVANPLPVRYCPP